MNRRSFLWSILAAAVAPAIVRADSLMRIVPRETVLVDPYFDSVTLLERFHGATRFAAPIVRVTELMETRSAGGIVGTLYEYSVGEVEILTGFQGERIHRVWADVQEIPVDRFTFNNGRATVFNLPIGDFGNRVPNFEFEVRAPSLDQTKK